MENTNENKSKDFILYKAESLDDFIKTLETGEPIEAHCFNKIDGVLYSGNLCSDAITLGYPNPLKEDEYKLANRLGEKAFNAIEKANAKIIGYHSCGGDQLAETLAKGKVFVEPGTFRDNFGLCNYAKISYKDIWAAAKGYVEQEISLDLDRPRTAFCKNETGEMVRFITKPISFESFKDATDKYASILETYKEILK